MTNAINKLKANACSFFILFLFLPLNVFAQTEPLLTPQQLKEDADFYFSTLFSKHPDPYRYYSSMEFEYKRNSIYERLNKPMTFRQFIWILGEINGYVDAHSRIAGITLPFWAPNSVISDKWLLFPNVKIEDEKVYVNDVEVERINGMEVAKILQEIKQYCNWKLPHERNWVLLQDGFSYFLLNKYEMKAPFKVKLAGSDKIQTWSGCPAGEYLKRSSLDYDIRGGSMVPYKVYPFSSIAIFTMLTFSDSEREFQQKELDNFFSIVKGRNIKHIFYDVTLNGGGQFPTLWSFGMNALNIVRHGDVYFRVKETRRTEQGVGEYQTNRMVLASNSKSDIPDDRKLYILQGTNTESCADYFCRIVAENGLGILVGQNTGEPTTAFTHADNYMMPNSKWSFQIATTLYDFSDDFKTETLHPDVYWDVNHNREFTEEELIKIVEHCRLIGK